MMFYAFRMVNREGKIHPTFRWIVAVFTRDDKDLYKQTELAKLQLERNEMATIGEGTRQGYMLDWDILTFTENGVATY